MNALKRCRFLGISLIILASASLLTGCGAGAKLLKEPKPLDAVQPLAIQGERDISVTLQWVIVRDGPGSWAKNADWDEYLLSVHNGTNEPLQVVGFQIIDSLGVEITPEAKRKDLVKQSRKTVKRYKSSDLSVKAGAGTGALLAASGAAVVVSAGVSYAALTSAVFTGASGGAAMSAAGGVFLLAPVFAASGIVKGVRHSAVTKQIHQRRTNLPVEVQAGEEQSFTMFFPLAPSPQALKVYYTTSEGEFSFTVDTREVLAGLHIE